MNQSKGLVKGDKYYLDPPVIPGVLFNTGMNMVIIFFACILFAFGVLWEDWNEMSKADHAGIYFGFAVLWFLVIRIPTRVYLDTTKAKVSYLFRREVSVPLEKFYIRVMISKGVAGSKNYGYSVSLYSKDFFSENGGNLSSRKISGYKTEKRMRIPIAMRILCPKNLKDFIEAFQRQIEKPLDMVFGSEQALRDYSTGQYQAGQV